MFGLGWPEVLVILGVVVLVFGSKRIPEVGSALGKTLRGFNPNPKPQTPNPKPLGLLHYKLNGNKCLTWYKKR